MSWEEMWTKKYPCKCGKGFYIETTYIFIEYKDFLEEYKNLKRFSRA